LRSDIGIKLMLILLLAGLLAEPALSQGLGQTCPCDYRNPAEVYCVSKGGCPQNGNCYFPDGSFCELWSFYNGTCPGREYYEQMLWEAEAYRFLYGDLYPVYSPYGRQYLGYYPYYYPYYPNYPNYYYQWPGYGSYGDPLSPYGMSG